MLFSGGQGVKGVLRWWSRVKADFWLVEILDPSPGRINRPYGSDTPLLLVCETGLVIYACERSIAGVQLSIKKYITIASVPMLPFEVTQPLFIIVHLYLFM